MIALLVLALVVASIVIGETWHRATVREGASGPARFVSALLRAAEDGPRAAGHLVQDER